ncbi:MAG: hypothetical protein IKO29_03245 [Bacteroidales bacterium]|nr:hypothetical protein [Bacteroidales bacterium]
MNQEFYSYPHFVANQVLKSKHLNDSFGYLDKQSRLTRAKLLGSGILDGLSFTFVNDVLTIKPGSLLNNRGWLYEMNEPVRYRYGALLSSKVPLPFNSDSLDELLTVGEESKTGGNYICFQTQEEALDLGFKPIPLRTIVGGSSNLKVALAVGVRSRSRACSGSSCDVDLNTKKLEILPLLLKPSASSNPVFLLDYPENRFLKPCPIASGNRFTFYVNLAMFQLELKRVFLEQRTETIEYGRYVWESILGQKELGPGPIRNGVFAGLFPDYKSVMNRFRNALLKIQALKAGSRTVSIPDYYLLFLEDIRLAIWDFLEEYDRFASKYRFLPNMDYSKDALVYLGSTDSSTADLSRSRYFNPHEEAFRLEIQHLQTRLERVAVLSEHFIGPVMNQGKVNPRPLCWHFETPDPSLSQKAIPAYYVQDDSFARLWHFDEYYSRERRSDYPVDTDANYLAQRKTDTTTSKKSNMKPVSIPRNEYQAYFSGYNDYPPMYLRLIQAREGKTQENPYSEFVLKSYNLSKAQLAFLRETFFTEKTALFFLKSAYNQFHKRLNQSIHKRYYDWLFDFNCLMIQLFQNYELFADALDKIESGIAPGKNVFTTFLNLTGGESKTQTYSFKEELFERDEFLVEYLTTLEQFMFKTDQSLVFEDRNHFRQILISSFRAFIRFMKYSYDPKFSDGYLAGSVKPGISVDWIIRENKSGKYILSYQTGVALNR